MSDIIAQVSSAIQQEMGLQLPGMITEEELLRILALKIKALLERDTEAFFQLMYRLDIQEHKLYDAMNTGDAPQAIAHLIYLRQIEKVQSRRDNRPGYNEEDADLKW
ncbi:MAG: hypothetical protein P4L41_11235 [Flavipsychrobacter sp.]|nr:hypothetical protein [Flavipsychrobacter sp.]